MPSIYELFGFPVIDKSIPAEKARKSATCPFMDTKCDGGGNRNQTKINLVQSEPLKSYFDLGIATVISGICSINAGEDTWVVCPRRLFAARNTSENIPTVNRSLQEYEREILLQTNLPKDQNIGIWSEVYIKQQIDDAEINYHFDYIAVPLIETTLNQLLISLGLEGAKLRDEAREFVKYMKKRGYYETGQLNPENKILQLPTIQSPYIFEVMTASTSGSDTENETDIRSSFRNAIQGKDHTSPGINKRQVWGRMVTQLFAKTALAQAWGGQTLWVIQDELLRNIELTTLLRTSKIAKRDGSDINLIVMHYRTLPDGSRAIEFKSSLTGNSGLNFAGSETFTDILLPKIIPPKLELARAILRRPIDAIVSL